MKEKSWHINDFKCVLEMAEQKRADSTGKASEELNID